MKAEKKLAFNKDDINQIHVNNRGKLLCACDDSGDVQVIDIRGAEGKLVKSLSGGHKNICLSAQFCPHNAWEVVSGSAEMGEAIVHWDFNRGRVIERFPNNFVDQKNKNQLVNPPFCNSLSYSRDGKTLAAALGDGLIGLYNVKEKTILGPLDAHSAGACAVEFANFGPPSGLLSASSDKTVVLWELMDQGEYKARFKKGEKPKLGLPVVRIGLEEKPNWIASTSLGSGIVCIADCSETIKCYPFR
mmetsp:Transcript_21735/g.43621  ORF Transcript_21735/g.43621 Transcript_21735/m.43621 type:complete len:246 (-) Transcript_21735:229-966(-)